MWLFRWFRWWLHKAGSSTLTLWTWQPGGFIASNEGAISREDDWLPGTHGHGQVHGTTGQHSLQGWSDKTGSYWREAPRQCQKVTTNPQSRWQCQESVARAGGGLQGDLSLQFMSASPGRSQRNRVHALLFHAQGDGLAWPTVLMTLKQFMEFSLLPGPRAGKRSLWTGQAKNDLHSVCFFHAQVYKLRNASDLWHYRASNCQCLIILMGIFLPRNNNKTYKNRRKKQPTDMAPSTLIAFPVGTEVFVARRGFIN